MERAGFVVSGTPHLPPHISPYKLLPSHPICQLTGKTQFTELLLFEKEDEKDGFALLRLLK